MTGASKTQTQELSQRSVRVAVVQAGSVLFDRERTVDKLEALALEAARGGAEVTLFPEAFIPAYPRGFSFGAVVGSRSDAGRQLWARYWESSVAVPGPTMDRLAQIARQTQMTLAVGLIERETSGSGGTLYCSLFYFGPGGEVLGKHRKVKPTASERLIWGEGDGSTLTVVHTPHGRLGGLICWENYMPLARMALYSKGVELYLAPTADARPSWQATLQHIAIEGRCFVLSCNQFVTREMLPADLATHPEMMAMPEVHCRGGSAIVAPSGQYLAGPLYDQEGILFADLDREQLVKAKYDFDVTGHYARPDLFRLLVDESPKTSVVWHAEQAARYDPEPLDEPWSANQQD